MDGRANTLRWVERLIYALFPSLMLQATPWAELWHEKERRENAAVWRIVFLLAALAYIAHYYLVDRALGREAEQVWFGYRFGLAAVAFVACALYFIGPIARSRFQRVPAYIACWVMAFEQANSMVWHEGAHYVYAFWIVILGALILRTSPFSTFVFTAFTLATQFPFFLEAGVPRPFLASATVLTLIFVYVARSKYLDDVRHFIAVL